MGILTFKLGSWIGIWNTPIVQSRLAADSQPKRRAKRKLMPKAFLLVPGVGAQGGDVSQLSVFFDSSGSGAIIAAARSIIYAYRKSQKTDVDFQEAARNATLELRALVEHERSVASERSTL